MRELDKAERRAESLQHSLASTEQAIADLRQRLVLLDQLAGEDAEAATALRLADKGSRAHRLGQAEPPNGFLRGSAIRRVAVRLLTSSQDPTAPIHYTNWFDLVQAAGYGIAGRDPAATFLTQVTRSPVVIRGDRSGTYALDLDAPRRLRHQLEALNTELLALHHGQQTIEEIISARDRRAELISAISRVERALEEAIEALGAEGNNDS